MNDFTMVNSFRHPLIGLVVHVARDGLAEGSDRLVASLAMRGHGQCRDHETDQVGIWSRRFLGSA